MLDWIACHYYYHFTFECISNLFSCVVPYYYYRQSQTIEHSILFLSTWFTNHSILLFSYLLTIHGDIVGRMPSPLTSLPKYFLNISVIISFSQWLLCPLKLLYLVAPSPRTHIAIGVKRDTGLLPNDHYQTITSEEIIPRIFLEYFWIFSQWPTCPLALSQ